MVFDTGPIATDNQFPCQTLVACLQPPRELSNLLSWELPENTRHFRGDDAANITNPLQLKEVHYDAHVSPPSPHVPPTSCHPAVSTWRTRARPARGSLRIRCTAPPIAGTAALQRRPGLAADSVTSGGRAVLQGIEIRADGALVHLTVFA